MRNVLLTALMVLSLAACESRFFAKDAVQGQIASDLQRAAQGPAKPPVADTVSQALPPPPPVERRSAARPIEPRFDLSVNNVPASQVYTQMASGTRYSMLVHPDVKGNITIDLKDVTLTEALEAVRELYGYEYKIQGTLIFVQTATIQTRLFQINYLAARRVGRADVRVSAASVQSTGADPNAQSAPPSMAAMAGIPGMPTPTNTTVPGTALQSIEGSRVTTTSGGDFWGDIAAGIRAITGVEAGRSVVVNAQAGVIVVRALPSELRSVEQYLKAMSLVADRQVMLEAKIIEVALSDQFAAGINWATFKGNFATGVIGPGTTLGTTGPVSTFTARGPDGSLLLDSTVTAGVAAQSLVTGATVPGTIFGLAFQTASFAALLNFLESQGAVHVLSSPRIAALNNQKAVLKVGTDELFVTNISTTTSTTGTTSTVSPTITLQPFFSGIALDVTPQISDDDQITLHIHPSVSLATDKNKTLNLGSTLGVITLPLASIDINESDTIVRVSDGSIAAIGGLMKQQQNTVNSGLPGTTDNFLGGLFGSRNRQLTKSELVILLKVTVIKGDAVWQQQAHDVDERMQYLRRPEVPANVSTGGTK